jgi:hypothetical protein
MRSFSFLGKVSLRSRSGNKEEGESTLLRLVRRTQDLSFDKTRFQKGTLLIPKDLLRLTPTTPGPAKDKPLKYSLYYFADVDSEASPESVDSASLKAILNIHNVSNSMNFIVSYPNLELDSPELCMALNEFLFELLQHRRLCSAHQFVSYPPGVSVAICSKRTEDSVLFWPTCTFGKSSSLLSAQENTKFNWITEDEEVLLPVSRLELQENDLLHKEVKLVLVDPIQQEIFVHMEYTSAKGMDWTVFLGDSQRQNESSSSTAFRILEEKCNISLTDVYDGAPNTDLSEETLAQKMDEDNVIESSSDSVSREKENIRKVLYTQLMTGERNKKLKKQQQAKKWSSSSSSSPSPSGSSPSVLDFSAPVNPAVFSFVEQKLDENALIDIYCVSLSPSQRASLEALLNNTNTNNNNHQLDQLEVSNGQWVKIDNLPDKSTNFNRENVKVRRRFIIIILLL